MVSVEMASEVGSDTRIQFPLAVPKSLVKYVPPIFAGLEPSVDVNQTGRAVAERGGEGEGKGKGKGKRDAKSKTSQLDDMINSMLPPREWTEETGTWMQYVSKEPATRLAVITLQVHHSLVDDKLCRG